MNKIPNRKAICDVLLKEAETDKDIVVLCSDSRGSASLAPAIVWQCSRASEICERIKTNVMIDPDREQKKNGGVAEIIRQKTGMHLSPYFPAAKFVWLQENVEEVKQAKRDNDLCLGTTVSLPRCEESSAFGAGLMAGLSCGLYKMESIFEVKNRNQFIPSMNAVEREQKYSGWKNAVEKVLV